MRRLALVLLAAVLAVTTLAQPDGRYDPLAAKTVRDPIQTNPYATC